MLGAVHLYDSLKLTHNTVANHSNLLFTVTFKLVNWIYSLYVGSIRISWIVFKHLSKFVRYVFNYIHLSPNYQTTLCYTVVDCCRSVYANNFTNYEYYRMMSDDFILWYLIGVTGAGLDVYSIVNSLDVHLRTERWTALPQHMLWSVFQHIYIYTIYVQHTICYIYSFRVSGDKNGLNRHVHAAYFRYQSDDDRLSIYNILFNYLNCFMFRVTGWR